ncbi:MAG: hypothetical protein LBD15_03390 [Holosporales bacterium]|nr:hypothetical protein [Holosporales bacterium]
MVLDTGFWVLASFVVFLLCCGRKLYRFATEALDKYSDDIAAQFKEAETLREEAKNIRKRLEERTVQMYAEIATLKETTQRDLEDRRKAHVQLLEVQSRAAQDLYAQQLAIAEASVRARILHTLTNQILQQVREHHTLSPASVDLTCLADAGRLLKTSA